jgi:aminotransferase
VALGLPRLDAAFYRGLTEEYSRKRQKLCGALTHAGLNPFIPQGAYYVLADVSSLPGSSSKQKAMFLLNQSGVASVPGDAFFQSAEGENFVRFCFAKPDEVLEEACRRLEVMSHKLQASESMAAG